MTTPEITAEADVPLIVITQEFDAPRELVFRAYTEPDLLARWIGPRELRTSVERYDLRDGGRWRYVQTDPDGNRHGFHGVFHGESSPDGIVQTFEFDGMPGHVSLQTTTLHEDGGRTRVRIVCGFQSVEDRDALVASGMERGVRDSTERLADLLTSLAAS
jgi:uncharacterized protein YndB with AHSA1/START domain